MTDICRGLGVRKNWFSTWIYRNYTIQTIKSMTDEEIIEFSREFRQKLYFNKESFNKFNH